MEVCFVTNRNLIDGDIFKVIKNLCKAGIDKVILREEDLSPRQLFDLAREIRKITWDSEVKLLINGSVEVAMAVEADGVHLGGDDLPIAAARVVLPPQHLVGVSVHSIEEAEYARDMDIDYVLAGNISDSNPYFNGKGVEWLKELVVTVPSIAVYAIGGINEDNVEEVMSSGIKGVALRSELLENHDPLQLIKKIKGI